MGGSCAAFNNNWFSEVQTSLGDLEIRSVQYNPILLVYGTNNASLNSLMLLMPLMPLMLYTALKTLKTFIIITLMH